MGVRKLAVVGWATDSGVGRELTDAIRHLPIAAAFVLRNPAKATRHDQLKGVPHQLSVGRGVERQMQRFLNVHKPSAVLTWEVPGSWAFPDIWKQKGIRWLHVVHWDWFAPNYLHLWKSAQLIAPNAVCQQALSELGLSSTLLPIPVDTSKLPFISRTEARRFGSVYGYGGSGSRRGLEEIVNAWRKLEACSVVPPLVIRAQQTPSEAILTGIEGVHLEVGNLGDPAMLYSGVDIAIQISRFEGVGLSLLEAQSCGVPVVTVDGEPMRSLAPDLMVSVERTEAVSIMGKTVTSYIASVTSLFERVRDLYGRDIVDLSQAARRRVERCYSWDVLRPLWLEFLFDSKR